MCVFHEVQLSTKKAITFVEPSFIVREEFLTGIFSTIAILQTIYAAKIVIFSLLKT